MKITHHAPSRVTVRYGADWTPLAAFALIVGACVYFATLLASILAAALVAMIAVAAGSVAVLVVVLHRNRVARYGVQAPAARPAVTARVVPAVGARQPRAIGAPAQHVHLHFHGDAQPEAVLRAISDAVPQRQEEPR